MVQKIIKISIAAVLSFFLFGMLSLPAVAFSMQEDARYMQTVIMVIAGIVAFAVFIKVSLKIYKD